LRVWETTEFKKGLSWDTGWKGTLSGLAALYSVDTGRRWAAVGGRDGAVYLFDAAAKKSLSPVHEVTAFKSPVRAVALNDDESLLASCSDKGDLCILDVSKGTVLTRETPHLQGVKALSWSANGLLASGSHDRSVKLWTCADGALQELLTLRQPGPVRWLAFHPDGVRLFVLLERESAVRVWHLDRLFARLTEMGLGAGLSPIRDIPLAPPAPEVPPDQPVVEPPSSPNGLKAELFDDMELLRCVKIRYDAKVDWRSGNKAPDSLLRNSEFSIRWTGWLKAPNSGKYTLQLESDEGARLWLDGKRLVDRWQNSSGKDQVEVELTGQPQPLRIEFMNLGGNAFIHFRWAQKGKAMQTVPSEALFHEVVSKRGKDGR
jgi:hypothetical protein